MDVHIHDSFWRVDDADEKASNLPFLLCSLISSPKVPPHKEIFKNSEVCPITRKYSYQMQ